MPGDLSAILGDLLPCCGHALLLLLSDTVPFIQVEIDVTSST